MRIKIKDIINAYTKLGTEVKTAMLFNGFGALGVGTDIGWLLGDMYHNLLIHHYFVLIGLSIALLGFGYAFIWRAVTVWKSYTRHVDRFPNYCGVSARKLTKKKVNYSIEFED